MKVVHLMGSLKPSGMERMFLSGASHFSKAGIASVIVGQGDDHPFAGQLRDAGYAVELIDPLRSGRGIGAWTRLLRSENPDVIHIHTEGTFALAVLISRWALPTKPIIRTVHNVFAPSGRARLSRKVQAAIADRFVAEFIAVSSDVQEHERSYGRELTLVFNWVDDRFLSIRPERNADSIEHAIVMVGNCSPIKNHIAVLRALMPTSLRLYFHGDETGASKDEIKLLNLLEEQGRLGHRGVGDPAESLKRARYFILPSKREGMGIALAEAITAGVPCVVSDVPGVRWASKFPFVALVGERQREWDRVLKAIDQGVALASDTDSIAVPIDLSAARGAGELVRVYRDNDKSH
jgi:glycosyltransferase involved in cell wall biosynthesis